MPFDCDVAGAGKQVIIERWAIITYCTKNNPAADVINVCAYCIASGAAAADHFDISTVGVEGVAIDQADIPASVVVDP